MEQILSLNLTNPAAGQEEYWIKLEQDRLDEVATMKEAAEIIDAMFDIDPCEPVDERPEEEKPSYEEQLEKAEKALKEFMLTKKPELCRDENGCFTATIKVFRSHQDRPYTLLIQGGVEIQTTTGHEESKSLTVAVKNSSSITLSLPGQTISATWQGPCYSTTGPVSRPDITISGNVVSWGANLTGVLLIQYSQPYDVVTILVGNTERVSLGGASPETQLTAGDVADDSCVVTGLYYLSFDEIELEPPPEDEETDSLCHSGDMLEEPPDEEKPRACTERIKVEVRCECSDKESDDSYYRLEPISCLPGEATGSEVNRGRVDIEYTSCENQEQVDDPAYYEEICCVPPRLDLWDLPRCKKLYQPFPGGSEPSDDDLEALRLAVEAHAAATEDRVQEGEFRPPAARDAEIDLTENEGPDSVGQ